MSCIRLLLVATWISMAGAQPREITVLGGGGFLPSLPIEGTPSSLRAGFGSGAAAGILVGQDLYRRWSGEIRYLFERRDLQIRSGGAGVGFSGQAHVVQYDLLFHTRPRRERVRPYFALGGGVKIFRGTGTETAYRPLMEYAYLTRTLQPMPMFTVGGGVKFQFKRMILRIDFCDQITRFPQRVITPAPGLSLNGWLQDFVPTVGLGWSR